MSYEKNWLKSNFITRDLYKIFYIMIMCYKYCLHLIQLRFSSFFPWSELCFVQAYL